MTRSTLATANATEAAANSARMVILLDIAFPSGTLYATSAERPIPHNGNRYVPSGVFSDAQGFAETLDLKARRISIRMSGVDASLITKLMNDAYNFAQANVYLGFCDDNWKLVADPHALGDSLLLSGASITLDQGSGVVEINAETRDILNARSSAQLATPESQRLRYPGDTGMDAVRAIMDMEVEWAGVRSASAATSLGLDSAVPHSARQ